MTILPHLTVPGSLNKNSSGIAAPGSALDSVIEHLKVMRIRIKDLQPCLLHGFKWFWQYWWGCSGPFQGGLWSLAITCLMCTGSFAVEREWLRYLRAVFRILIGLNTDPDPAFYVNTDSDPAFKVNRDPDLGFFKNHILPIFFPNSLFPLQIAI